MMHPSQPGGTSRLIAKGFERVALLTAEVAAKSHNGMEQRLVIRSCLLAQAGQRGLRARLAKAQAPVMALDKRGRGHRRCTDPRAIREAVDALLARDRVQGLLDVQDKEQRWERPLWRDARRNASLRLE